VTVGAYDWSGRHVVAVVRVLHGHAVTGSGGVGREGTDSREQRVIELPGWPLDHERFLRETLASVVGTPLTLGAVRRVAEPLAAAGAPSSDAELSVTERGDRVHRRRSSRRPEARDHADRRKR